MVLCVVHSVCLVLRIDLGGLKLVVSILIRLQPPLCLVDLLRRGMPPVGVATLIPVGIDVVSLLRSSVELPG